MPAILLLIVWAWSISMPPEIGIIPTRANDYVPVLSSAALSIRKSRQA